MEMLRTGMNPSNWVAWTILPRRSASLPMGDLHDLHEDRPDLAYSAFQAFGGVGAAIPPAATAGSLLSLRLGRGKECSLFGDGRRLSPGEETQRKAPNFGK
jgi:hypothetical protein